MLSKTLKKLTLVSTVILTVGTSFSFAQKPNIKRLTSEEKAKEVKDEIQQVTAESRIPNAVQLHSVGIGIGQTFIEGDFDDYGDDQITLDLLYNYSASHSFDLLIDLHYSKHSFRTEYVRLMGLTAGIKGKFFNFDAFSPYLLGGLGFYSPKVKRTINNQLLESESKVVFGTHIGVGGDLRLNKRVTMGILAQYHNPFDVKQELGPEVEGSYFKLLITALYSF
jgi:hypothetical protein